MSSTLAHVRSLLPCALGVLVVALAGGGDALACSCSYEDPDERLKRADAAVVGTVIQVESLGDANPYSGHWRYTLQVEEDYKRDLGATEVVTSRGSSPTCGLELREGDRVGLFLHGSEPWEVSLCSTFEPGELRARTKKLPPPVAGRLWFLAGGFGTDSTRLVGLDRSGRAVAYGRGPGTTRAVAICPGSRRAVEFVERGRGARRYALAVRRLDDFRIVRSVRLPLERSDFVAGIACTDKRASDAYVVSSLYRGDGVRSRLIRVRGSRTATLVSGQSQTAAFGDGVVYVDHAGRDIRAIDLSNGRRTRLASGLSGVLHLALSPEGTALSAVVDGQSGEAIPESDVTEVAVLNLTADPPALQRGQVGEAGIHGGTTWLDSERLFYYPTCCEDDGRLFDIQAQPLGTLEWPADGATFAGGRLYGMAGDVLHGAEPPGGAYRVGTLFGSLTTPLVAVPKPPRVRASRACASAAA